MTGLPDIEAVLDEAGRRGRTQLTEAESYLLAMHLGFRIPAHVVVDGPGRVNASALDELPGDRVVVKAVAPELVHKAAAGAVRFVARRVNAVVDAIGEIAAVVRSPGYLIAEHIDGEGPELMVGYRRTAAFGSVLIVGAGGVLAEQLADALGFGVVPVPCDASSARRATRRAPFRVPGLAESLITAAEAAASLPGEISAIDLNPVVVTRHGLTALDAFTSLQAPTAGLPERDVGRLDALFRPGTIGLIGVSSGENPGRAILRNVLAAGFPPERVVVVKPGVEEIDGVRCVPALEHLPEPVDLFVVAVGAEAAAGVVEELSARGAARSVILIPGGMGERAGSEPLADRVQRVAGPSGPLIVGGNCMGIRSGPGSYDTTFIPAARLAAAPEAPETPLAVISQSGAFAIARLDRFPRLRPRYLVTLGNQIDVTVGDALRYVAADSDVRVAACYVEGFRPGDGTRFLSGARALTERGGVVVLFLGGRTGPGRISAASHTAAIATDARVAAALAEHAGVLVVDELEEFEDLLRIATTWHERTVPGTRVGVVTNAGFEAVAAADSLGPLRLADISPDTVAALDGVLGEAGIGAVVAAGNPLDLTPITDDARYGEAVAAMLDDPGVDVAVVGCVPLTPALRARADEADAPGSIGEVLAGLAAHPTPWIAVVDGGRGYDRLRAMLDEAGVPVFSAADRAVRALGRYVVGRAGR